MENERIDLNNISKRLNEITDYLVDLKKETARVVIKQIYYNCFLNKLKLEDIFEILSEMREETNLRLQIELDKIIAKTSINNVLEILNEEINTAINVDIALIMYLITNEDIQAILEDDIPVLLNFTKILYSMNTKFDNIKTRHGKYVRDSTNNDSFINCCISYIRICNNL